MEKWLDTECVDVKFHQSCSRYAYVVGRQNCMLLIDMEKKEVISKQELVVRLCVTASVCVRACVAAGICY